MTLWMQLLATSLPFGAGIAWGMVLRSRTAPVLLAGAGASLLAAGSAVGAITRHYQTPQALGAAVFFALAGAATGYAISAAALPLLALTRRTEIPTGPADVSHQAVVLLACTDPERYDPRAVALQGADLARTGAVDVPLAAAPFVYLADKARYRALGGHSPGAALASALRDETERALDAHGSAADVRLAWSHSRPALTDAITRLAGENAGPIAVVVLGTEDSDAVDRAKMDLDASCSRRGTPVVVFGDSVWTDRALPDRLVERIIGTIGNAERTRVGVVLVCAGQPITIEHAHAAASAEDTYFNQRVRMLLAEAGLDEQLVRVAWLEWQLPDVTETARHLAALGCMRLIVAPSTILLPTVSTALDVRHAVELARLPGDVVVTTLSPWGDDEVMVRAIANSALGALESLRRPSGP